jgi:glycosyltransferase involved in cell wall biosynthesis
VIRVLHLLGSAMPAGTAQFRIVDALARGLDPDRYELHAYFLDGGGPLAGSLAERGVAVRSIAWSGARGPHGAYRFMRALRADRPQIVHRHVGSKSVSWVVRAATRARLVTSLYTSISESGPPLEVRELARASDAVIAVSRAVASAIDMPVDVVYPCASVADAIPSAGRPPSVLGIAARLAPIKGIRFAIEALAELHRGRPDLRLEIAGTGPDHARLTRLTESLDLASRVTFLGWQRNLPAVYGRWAVLVAPSLYEGLPLSVLEAMAAGLPVVATRAGGVPEAVEHGRTGLLVPPGDPRALAAACERLLADDRLRSAMGEAGRRRVAEHFTESRMTTSIATIYDELAESRLPRACVI